MSRFIVITIILILMWSVLIGFLYLKADEVTKNPCTICAQKIGAPVTCSVGYTNIIFRTFFENGTIRTSYDP